MKNKMKRVLAFVVAFAMVFTLMPGNSLVLRAEEANSCTFAVDYDDANEASVSCTVGSDELFKPTRFEEYNFMNEEGAAQTVTFTLTPPSSVPEGEIAEIHVLANGQDLEVQDNTVTFTPDADKSYFIRICWTHEEYNYESCDVDRALEVSDFMVEYNVSGRGTVSLNSIPERSATRGTSTKAIYSTTTDSVEFILTPEEGKDFAELIVGESRYSKQDLMENRFDKGKLVQTGEILVFTLNTSAYEDNAWEWMEFIFTDDSSQGGGNQSGTFMIDYDAANGASVSCKVGDNTPYNPDRFTYYNFVTGEGEAQTVTFTLTPPSNVPDGETAEVHVLANGQALDVRDNTATLNPTAGESYFIRICWTQEEYNYESCDVDRDPEVSDFMVEYNVSGRGAVSLKTPTEKKTTRGTSTKAIYSTTTDSVEFILTLEEGKDFVELIVGQQPFSKQDLINGLFSDGTLVQTGEVLVFTLNTSACNDNDSAEWMEFRFTDDNPPGPVAGGATNRDTYATYENSATSALTVTGKAEGYINGSWFSNIEASIENQNIEYPVPFDPSTIQSGDVNKVEFEFVTLINERYTSIKINGVDYTDQIPGMREGLTEDEITQAVLNAIALNNNNQDTSFIIEVPYAESYTVEATRVEIGSEDAAYWPVGNFLWSGVDMSGDEPEGPSFISVENEQYGGTVDYVIGELRGKYSYFTPSDVSEETTVKLIVCDTNGAPTAKITGGDKDGTSLEFTAGEGPNTYETDFTYTSDMEGVVVTLAVGTEEVETYQDSVEGGSFELLKFTYMGTTYTREENQSWDEVFREKNLPCYFDWTQIFDGEGNLLNGSAVFPAGAELTIQLLPDYGHQLTAFGFNGRSLTAGEDPATYTVTVPNGNFHINCLFEEVAPTTKVDAKNTVVTEAELSVRETDVPVESGTLNMTVKDATLDKSKYPDALAAVDINLENVFYDVNTRGVKDDWTKEVTELNDQVEVTLKVERLDTNKAYQVIREHYVQNGNGEPVLNTETLEAQVNEDGTITFESDRFSTYVIEEVPDIVCNQSKDVTLRFWKFDEEQRAYVPAYDSIGYFYINNGSAEDGGNPYDIPGSRLRLHNGVIKKAGRETGTNELLFQGEIGFAISGAYLLSDKAKFNEAGILTDPDFASSTKLSTTTKDVISNSGNKTENNIYSASLAVTENASETYDILVETKSRHTIVWENHETKNFGADALIENGAATLVSVKDAEGNDLLETGEANYSGDGDSGYCMIPDGAYVTVKLIPDYGYQVLSASIAGDSATLTPNTDVSSFTFVMPSTNVHFRGIMQPANDKMTESADKVSAVTIADGANAATYGGNLQLTVKDNETYNEANLSDVADTAGKSAEVKVEQVATLDLQLDNIINQAAADKYWTENVTSFENDIKVKLTLDNVSLADGEKLVVVREHDGKLEKIEAQYQDGVITVPTNKFSTYSIVKTSPITECEHTYVAEIDSAISNQLASKATCTSKAKYYKYCSVCNELSTETFEYGEVDKTNHVGDTEVRNAKTATCVVDGYTGDTYCMACDTKISSGTAIKATGHSFVAEVNAKITNQLASKATCTSKAKYYKYCSVCNELSTETFEYGEVDLTNHVGDTEVRGAKKATCTEDGYTGDTYCKACDTKISSGTVIKAAGHKFDAGKVTKEPTVDAEGVKTYTCTVCGATKTEPIAKLPKPEPTPDPDLPGEEFAENNGNIFTEDEEGDIRCFTEDGEPVIDEFMCDGEYTYYFQADGTAMKDRLTYHPDGVHVIYFDENGHEVFSDFAHITRSIAGEEVDDYCFFDVYGHMYVDTLTYDKTGTKLYYINEYGLLQHTGWFAFSGHEFEAGLGFEGKAGGYGYANADGSLMTNCYTYDWDGNFVYIQGDGHMFR